MGVGSTRDRAAAQRRARQAPRPAVQTSYVCPTCSQAHRLPVHGGRGGLSGLDERALQILKANALDELAAAVRGKADQAHLRDIVRVVDRIEKRLTPDD